MRVALIVLAMLLPLAAAQPTQIEFSVPTTTFYAHGGSGADGDHWMDHEPDGGSGAPGAAGVTSVTYTIRSNPLPDQQVALDPDGTVTIIVYMGASNGAGSGDVSTAVKQGSDVIAQGAGKEYSYTLAEPQTGGQYDSLQWDVPVEAATIRAGEEIVWTVTFDGAASGNFMGMGSTRGYSQIQLPVISVGGGSDGPDVSKEYVSLDDVVLEQEATGLAAAHFERIMNWTAAPANVTAVADVDLGGGNITMTVIDAANTTLLDESPTESGRIQTDVVGQAGTWQVVISGRDFTGNYTITLAETIPAAGGGDGNDGDSNDGDGNDGDGGSDEGGDGGTDGSGNETGGGDKDSPGAGMFLILTTLAVALAARRR